MADDFQTSSSPSSCDCSSSSESDSPVQKTMPLCRSTRTSPGNISPEKSTASGNAEEGYESDGFETEWRRRVVMLEGYVDGQDGSEEGSDGVGRTKSLTDDDLEELKGCLDLGFGFSYDEIPELCGTLPALELCYSLSQRFLEEKQQRTLATATDSLAEGEKEQSFPLAAPMAASQVEKPNTNWRISEPGDDPEEVKARLKYWAQAVACTVRLCS